MLAFADGVNVIPCVYGILFFLKFSAVFVVTYGKIARYFDGRTAFVERLKRFDKVVSSFFRVVVFKNSVAYFI